MRFHAHPQTGNPGVCRAVKNQCPFGEDLHGDSLEAAEKAYRIYALSERIIANPFDFPEPTKTKHTVSEESLKPTKPLKINEITALIKDSEKQLVKLAKKKDYFPAVNEARKSYVLLKQQEKHSAAEAWKRAQWQMEAKALENLNSLEKTSAKLSPFVAGVNPAFGGLAATLNSSSNFNPQIQEERTAKIEELEAKITSNLLDNPINEEELDFFPKASLLKRFKLKN